MQSWISSCRGPIGHSAQGAVGERLDIDPSGARCGCFLPDLTRLARRLPAPTSRPSYRRVGGIAQGMLGVVQAAGAKQPCVSSKTGDGLAKPRCAHRCEQLLIAKV